MFMFEGQLREYEATLQRARDGATFIYFFVSPPSTLAHTEVITNIGHNYVGHNLAGHNYINHSCVGHDNVGRCHNIQAITM